MARLATRTPTLNRPNFDMTVRKSKRDRKATVTFDDKIASSSAPAPKLTSKTARNKPETALKPVAVKPLPEIDTLQLLRNTPYSKAQRTTAKRLHHRISLSTNQRALNHN